LPGEKNPPLAKSWAENRCQVTLPCPLAQYPDRQRASGFNFCDGQYTMYNNFAWLILKRPTSGRHIQPQSVTGQRRRQTNLRSTDVTGALCLLPPPCDIFMLVTIYGRCWWVKELPWQTPWTSEVTSFLDVYHPRQPISLHTP
jgi:hypothetical protein